MRCLFSLKNCLHLFLTIFIFWGCSKDSIADSNNKTDNSSETSTAVSSTNIDDLMSLSSGSTYSTATPMGNHFQNLMTATNAQITWLNDATKEPSIPIGKEATLTLKSFSVTLYPYSSPIPADCNQTIMGDCSAISIFSELSYTNPSFIKSIIKDNGNNTYTVDMFDPMGSQIKVTVSNKFLSYTSNGSIVAVTGKNKVPTWSTILEKALMKYIDVYKLVSSIEGIGSEYASPPFTGNGNSFSFSPAVLTSAQLQRAVEISLKQKKLVIGGFNKADVKVGQSKTVTGHAWSFFLGTTNQNLFVMRNPWGIDNGSDLDGLMNIPNNESITDLIDVRIIDAGSAKASTIPGVYTPPKY